MATAMRSAWILSILVSSALCTSSMISGLLSKTSLMMDSSSLRCAGVNALGLAASGAFEAAGVSAGSVDWAITSGAPRNRIAGAISTAALTEARVPKSEADGLGGMNIPSVAIGVAGRVVLAQVGI